MVQVHHGRKTRKAQNSDHFRGEWLAHQAAMKEEDRDIDDEDMSYEEWLAGDMDTPWMGKPRVSEAGTIIA